ncbi:cyclin-dependent protein kinase inhibitor SMR6-like [Cynara cardunculus var. scolymus]|uniref:Cyclin-dependent kinase inhibitor n=1 Tax=Cynara cardunculus var. scolymus TaxID=59895 RepID=A0A103XE12_CYNCS|nr:cyclin-dependent protein kinase inhibitor SMR6-like [Cynara cardunculus var. scolymus]KVH88934.1 hypothetical protein Ccrd_024669 [Cynara cardunculus var. scolymus]
MGIAEETMESETTAKKWVIAGIQFMSPLKPIYTKKEIGKTHEEEGNKEEEEEEKECCTTPTTPESRIPCLLKCPGAPMKRKAVSRSHCNGVRDYFKPPDLESVFIRCIERA